MTAPADLVTLRDRALLLVGFARAFRPSDALHGKPAELPTFDDGLVTQEVLAKIGYLPSKATG